jgi:hypothetical protein
MITSPGTRSPANVPTSPSTLWQTPEVTPVMVGKAKNSPLGRASATWKSWVCLTKVVWAVR